MQLFPLVEALEPGSYSTVNTSSQTTFVSSVYLQTRSFHSLYFLLLLYLFAATSFAVSLAASPIVIVLSLPRL